MQKKEEIDQMIQTDEATWATTVCAKKNMGTFYESNLVLSP